MIKKLKEADRNEVMTFLSQEPSINLFMIGDIEAYGFDHEIQDLYGQYEDQKLIGVLLRFNENFIPYFNTDEFDEGPFSEIILEKGFDKMISGKESVVIKFKHLLDDPKLKSTYFCELKTSENLIKNNEKIHVAQESDARRIYDFLESIEEFSGFGSSVDRLIQKINNKTGRVYFMTNASGDIMTVSQTTAENSKSAMIVGVATHQDYRGKGYMSSCLSKLCFDVLSEGKSLCLFYDNPKAGSVYHKLGFVSIDKWMMLTK